MEIILIVFILFCIMLILAAWVDTAFHEGERIPAQVLGRLILAALRCCGAAFLISWAVGGIQALL